MRKRVLDPQAFGKVAVLMGGWSAEREVSLLSGAGVTAALKKRGIDAIAVDADRKAILQLRMQGFDRVFNILHGGAGENGTVQAALNLQDIPFSGSDVLASALGMDKLRCKRMWKAEGLPTPDWRWLRSDADALTAGEALGYPLFIKPSEEGSSVGVTKVLRADQAVAAFRLAAGENAVAPKPVLAERAIAGGEYTCAILDGEPLPLIRIEPAGEFYDYHAKYIADDTRYICPTGLVPTHETELQALCLRAYELVGCRGWARVDFMLDASGSAFLIEVNTNPGMTSHSLVPMAAAARGMSYEDLCWAILETTLEPAT
jgi:D-alanine-D-alanine ligase